jgi:hypothetical protein
MILFVSKYLNSAERTVQTTANRIALRDQAEKDVADPLDVEFDRCLAAEFHEAQFSCRKLTNYLNYGQQVRHTHSSYPHQR